MSRAGLVARHPGVTLVSRGFPAALRLISVSWFVSPRLYPPSSSEVAAIGKVVRPSHSDGRAGKRLDTVGLLLRSVASDPKWVWVCLGREGENSQ